MRSLSRHDFPPRSRFRTVFLAGIAATAATAASLAMSMSASAAVASTTGAAQVVAAPPSVAVGAFESNTDIRVFSERQVALTVALSMWSIGPNGTVTPSTVGAGRCVQSHLIHYDAVGTANPTLTGSATFTTAIIGVIPINNPLPVIGRPLDATDATFGAPGTTYPTPGRTARGIELFSVDSLTYTPSSPKTLGFRLGGDGFDEVRVLTACDTPPPDVPEAPFPVLMPLADVLLVGAGAALRRRRQLVAR